MTYALMADAAFASNIPPGFDIAAGYVWGPDAYHIWPGRDWDLFPGLRLPIGVPLEPGSHGADDGASFVTALTATGVPDGSIVAVDVETVEEFSYLVNFGRVVQQHYKVWVYGSRSTVFANPPLNGYWVADYGLTYAQVRELLALPHVRAVQDRAELPPGFDESLVKPWTEGEMWHG